MPELLNIYVTHRLPRREVSVCSPWNACRVVLVVVLKIEGCRLLVELVSFMPSRVIVRLIMHSQQGQR